MSDYIQQIEQAQARLRALARRRLLEAEWRADPERSRAEVSRMMKDLRDPMRELAALSQRVVEAFAQAAITAGLLLPIYALGSAEDQRRARELMVELSATSGSVLS